jgi:hypothetical protein
MITGFTWKLRIGGEHGAGFEPDRTGGQIDVSREKSS